VFILVFVFENLNFLKIIKLYPFVFYDDVNVSLSKIKKNLKKLF
jgi:hypothetical protein